VKQYTLYKQFQKVDKALDVFGCLLKKVFFNFREKYLFEKEVIVALCYLPMKMNLMLLKYLLLVFYCFLGGVCFGQMSSKAAFFESTERQQEITDSSKAKFPSTHFIVKNIITKGNHRTWHKIIQREVPFLEHDTIAYSDTAFFCRRIEENVFNTKLFLKVKARFIPDSTAKGKWQKFHVFIRLEERWYLIPYPVIEFADRTFTEWYYNNGADIKRINYGIRVTQNNTSGNNDPLVFSAQTGFLKRYDASYRLPYWDKAQLSGLSISAAYSTNRSFAVYSQKNKQVFFKDTKDSTNVARQRTVFGISYTRRNGIYTYHEAVLGYNANRISDSAAKANPDYYLNGATTQRFFVFRYSFRYDRRNFRFYPTKGYFLSADLEQQGLLKTDDVAISIARFKAAKYFTLSKKLFFSIGTDVITSFPQQLPYSNILGLGYQLRIVRGYDKYVVEGPISFLGKSTLRYKLYEHEFHPRFMPLKQFRSMPFALYPKVFLDAGYVHNNFTSVSNREFTNSFLPGGGIGIDMVTFYDIVFRFEYAINKKLERGFYFYLMADI